MAKPTILDVYRRILDTAHNLDNSIKGLDKINVGIRKAQTFELYWVIKLLEETEEIHQIAVKNGRG